MKSFVKKFIARVFQKQEGFLILEFALVLTLISIVFGRCCFVFLAQSRFEKNKITRENQKIIFDAIEQCFAQYGYIPPPRKFLGIGDHTTSVSTIPGQRIQIGLVPYKDLGLSLNVAKDGNGHWMTYIVSAPLTDSGHQLKESLCKNILFSSRHILDVTEQGQVFKDYMNALAQNRKKKNAIAVVLISHGVQGGGAFNGKSEKRFPLSKKASRCKKTNYNLTLSNHLFKHSVCASPEKNDVGISDDIVQWLTSAQLAKGAHLTCSDLLDSLPIQGKGPLK